MGGRLNFLGGKSMKIDNYIEEEIITGKDITFHKYKTLSIIEHISGYGV